MCWYVLVYLFFFWGGGGCGRVLLSVFLRVLVVSCVPRVFLSAAATVHVSATAQLQLERCYPRQISIPPYHTHGGPRCSRLWSPVVRKQASIAPGCTQGPALLSVAYTHRGMPRVTDPRR